MTYRDDEITQLKGEVAYLTSDTDYLLQEIEDLKGKNKRLASMVPSGPSRFLQVLLTFLATVLALPACLIASIISIGCIATSIEWLKQNNEDNVRSTHPQVTQLSFGERVDIAELQELDQMLGQT